MRAISVFKCEAGTSTLGWRALIALRTLVSMSAMGSLVIRSSLPAGLDHARNFAVQCELAEAQAAHAELAQKCARPAAAPAAVAVTDFEFRLLLQILRHLCGGCHLVRSLLATAGTACPWPSTTPALQRRCEPWW